MRKIIFSIAVLIIVALIPGPFFAGIWFQKNYRDLISFYNSQNVHIAILDYQRGWFSSDLILEVQVNQKYFHDFSKMLIKQHVQHGPIIFRSFFLGLAVIQNKIIFPSNIKIESETFASFFGNYFNHLLISGFNISDPDTDIKTGIKNITANFWIFPGQQRVKGELEFTHFFVKDIYDLLAIPFAKIKWDQYLDQHDVWLGSGAIQLSEILFKETDEKDIRVTDFYLEGSTKADNDFLNADRKIKIKNIEIEDQLIGPVEMEITFNQFYLPAIHDLLESYKNFLQTGQVYQGQLKQQISMILPKIVKGGSSIDLNKLDIAAANGTIKANGIFIWPEKNFFSPDNLRELIMSGQAELNISVSKKLLSQIIHLASASPDFIRDVAEPQRNLLMNVRDEMEFAIQRNALFIDFLSAGGYISKQAEDTLIDLQKKLVPMDDYAKAVRDLFLDRQIPLVASYQLCWQYSEILKPYLFLEDRVSEFQKIAEQQIREQFASLLKKRYVNEGREDYSAKLIWSENVFTSNGVNVK